MNKEEILNTFLLANISEIITQEEFDDVKKAIFKMLKENKILKENSYHNDKVVDKVNWENQLLKKQIAILDKTNIQLISKLDRYDAIVDERDELKKQLEEAQENIILLKASKSILEYKKALEENQQKEFISYLKDKLCIANKVLDNPEEDEDTRGYVLARKFMLEEILSKYKEIIGNNE